MRVRPQRDVIFSVNHVFSSIFFSPCFQLAFYFYFESKKWLFYSLYLFIFYFAGSPVIRGRFPEPWHYFPPRGPLVRQEEKCNKPRHVGPFLVFIVRLVRAAKLNRLVTRRPSYSFPPLFCHRGLFLFSLSTGRCVCVCVWGFSPVTGYVRFDSTSNWPK